MRWDRSRAGQGGGFHTTFASTESGEGGVGGRGICMQSCPRELSNDTV